METRWTKRGTGEALAESKRSVPSRTGGRGAEPLGALVTEEVVAGEDVVDLQAVCTREPLADVALQEALAANFSCPLAIGEQGVAGRASAGLAVGSGRHSRSTREAATKTSPAAILAKKVILSWG
jgi:hypothetical protein